MANATETETTEAKPKRTRNNSAKAKAEPTPDPTEVTETTENMTAAEIAAALGIQEPNNVGRPVSAETKRIHAELDKIKEIGGQKFASVLYANVGISADDKGKQKVYRAVSKWCDARLNQHNEQWVIDRKISGKDGYAVRLVPSEN